jgi:hypothetical protein
VPNKKPLEVLRAPPEANKEIAMSNSNSNTLEQRKMVMSSTFYDSWQVNKRKEEIDLASSHLAAQMEKFNKFIRLYPYSEVERMEDWRFLAVFGGCDEEFVTFTKRGRKFTARVVNPAFFEEVYKIEKLVPREENAVDNALQSLEGTINKAIEVAKK